MMKSLISLIVIVVLIAQSGAAVPRARASAPQPLAPSEKAWEWADKQLRKMSVDQKIGQLIHIGINARFTNQGSAYFRELKRQVVDHKIGGIIFFGAPVYETTHLGNRMQELAEIPLLLSLDAETGVGMRFGDAVNFPWAMAVAATGEPEYARRIGVITGREARALGIYHVFSPVLDVNNNADNPVINVRSFGEDPADVARFGVAFIEGLQSQRVLATAKHFPGHGDTNVDSHRGLPMIDHSRESLDKTELLPFREAVKAGVGSVMIAHIGLPQIDGEEVKPLPDFIQGDAEVGAEVINLRATVPATMSAKVQTGILREEMGFKGLIVSDALSMTGLTIYFTQEEAGVRALLAGTDILEKPADVDAMIRGLKAAAASGRLPESRLNDAVRKQLAWKHELGLTKQKITPLDKIDTLISGADSEMLTDEVASKSITLVRSEPGVLPLERTAKIAVLGISNGFEGPQTMGSLSSALRSRGLRFKPAYLQENSTAEQADEARKAVAEADIIVAGLYGRVRTGAKNSVDIPEPGAGILKEAIASGKKVVGISFGNPYILSSFPDMKTYIVAYGDMPSLQRASARAILGEQDLSGRLPISLPGLHPRGTGIQLRKK